MVEVIDLNCTTMLFIYHLSRKQKEEGDIQFSGLKIVFKCFLY